MHPNKTKNGFSLLELLVTLGIISIIAAIGAPSFQGAIRSSRLTTAINEFSNATSIARSNAVKLNRHVVIRKTGANWENGWQIFTDIDRTAGNIGVFNDDGDTSLCEASEDCFLHVYPALNSSFTLRNDNHTASDNFDNFLDYTPAGMKNGGIVGFFLCDTKASATPQTGTSKVLILNTVGRAQIAPDSNKNGIPERVLGTDITTCTP